MPENFCFFIYFTNYLCYYSIPPPPPSTPLTPPSLRTPTLPIPPASVNTNTKNAFLGMHFSCSWLPSPHPQPPNTKNMPTTARFQCSASSSSPPYAQGRVLGVWPVPHPPPFPSPPPFRAFSP